MIRLLGWWLISIVPWFILGCITYGGAKHDGHTTREAEAQGMSVFWEGWGFTLIVLVGYQLATKGGW